MFKKKQPLSFQEVLSKLMRYCSYQERSPFEVKQKVISYGLSVDKADEIVTLLTDDNFIDEKRFGELYVKGKMNVKRWGRYKIKEGLSSKGLRGKAIVEAINTIDEKQYRENLNYLIEKKIRVEPELKKSQLKLYRFLQSKGYESELISELLLESKKLGLLE